MSENVNRYEEKTINREMIYEGRIISVYVDEVSLPDGKTGKRELVKHQGAVAILALKGNKLLVVEQFRKPLERNLIEIPAGRLDPGEKPYDAARRELEEETGYACDHLVLLSSFYTSPGFADEIIHLFVAEELYPGQKKLDEDEFLQHQEITLTEAKQYIANGQIKDAKTITAVYAWQLFIKTGEWS